MCFKIGATCLWLSLFRVHMGWNTNISLYFTVAVFVKATNLWLPTLSTFGSRHLFYLFSTCASQLNKPSFYSPFISSSQDHSSISERVLCQERVRGEQYPDQQSLQNLQAVPINSLHHSGSWSLRGRKSFHKYSKMMSSLVFARNVNGSSPISRRLTWCCFSAHRRLNKTQACV